MIQGVIFDFDNTIYNYNLCNKKGLENIFNYISLKYSVNVDYIFNIYNKINTNIKNSNNYANKFNKSIYFKQLLENLSIELKELEIILNLYEDGFNSKIELYPGIIEFILMLKKINIKIGMLSNNLFLQQYSKLLKLNILEYFDYIQTTEEVGYEKPSLIPYLILINKMGIDKENIIMIGDNYNHDIIPALELNLIPFLFTNNNEDIHIIDKYFKFGSFIKLTSYLEEYFDSENKLIFLSKYFGQSELNIQGQGGNISVKSNNLLLIKSSGCILGNINRNEGFCIVNNSKCNDLLNNMDSKLINSKLFGYKNPSMETFFHCFMKKYTIHIHFTLSNKFLCSFDDNILNELEINNELIDYYLPGLKLALKVKEKYTNNCNLYFLKNHGLIITTDNFDDIFVYFNTVYNFFNNKLSNNYLIEYNTFNITKLIYENFNKSIVCKLYYNIDIKYIINIKYCFPDLAVYIQNIKIINDLKEIKTFLIIPEIIIYSNNIYLLADNLIKIQCIIETLNLYKELCTNYDNLLIISANKIQNMDEEKYRKNN
jgi:putative hydrolase of the HAD superfamily